MAEIASAFVSLLPSAKGFGPKLESEVGREVDGAGKRLGGGFGKVFAAAGGVLAAAGIGSFLKGAVGDARESQKISALTEQVIKTTGGAAKVTATQVQDLAGSIAAKTGIDDAAIQSASNLLLTFTNLRNEVGKGNDIFNQATKIATDMGAALGTEPKAAAIQLGKALNDPVKGVGALSRVGASFTEQQKEMIKGFVEGGETAKAQKIILAELNKEFGGAAEAQAAAGDKAAFAFGELKEQIGAGLLPVIDAAANAFIKFAPTLSKAIDGIGPAFGRAVEFAQPFIDTVTDFFSGSGGSGALAGIKNFASSFIDGIVPILETAANTFQTKLLPAAIGLGSYLAEKLGPIFSQVFGIVRTEIIPLLSSLAQWFYGKVYPAVINLATAIGTALKPVFDQIFQTIQTSVLPTVQKLLVKFKEYQPEIQKLVERVGVFVGGLLKLAAAILAKVLPPVIRFAGFLISRLVPAIANLIGFVVKVINKVIDFGGTLGSVAGKVGQFGTKLAGTFTTIVEKVTGFVSDVVNKIKSIPDKITAVAKNFLDAGKEVMGKIFDGIKEAATGAAGFVSDIVSGIKNGINDALHLPFTISGPGPLPDFTIPAFARGGFMRDSGVAMVGERGPELVYLNRGAEVKTAAETRRMITTPRTLGASLAGVGGGADGMRAVLQVGDREFTAYLRMLADDRVSSAADLGMEARRAAWSR